MPTIDPVILQLRADIGDYNQRVNEAQTNTDRRLSAIERASTRMSATVQRSFVAARTAALSFLAGVSAVAIARGIVSIGDEAKKLDAQLKLATTGFGSFGQAQEDVSRIANATRSDLSATVALYSNFTRATKEMGASQADAARATETFSKTLKISGANGAEAASATLQFGQALAAGALRGDELNSILEASPRLARLLAESMGQPIGQIKKLGEEGKLTSDKLLAALTDKKFTAGIDGEFNQLPLTVDDAMTRIRNASITAFGAFDRGGEFSTMLANFIGDGADGFADLADKAEEAGVDIRATFEGLGSAFDPLMEAGSDLFTFLTGESQGWGEAFREEIRNTLREFDSIRNFSIDIDNQIAEFGNRVKTKLNEAQRRAGAKPGDAQFETTPLEARSDTLGAFDRRFNAVRDRLSGQAAERRFRNMVGGYDALGNPLRGTPGATPPPKPSAAPSSSKKKGAAKRSPLDADAFAREEANLNDELLRLKADEVVDYNTRSQIELERLSAAKTAYAADVNADKRFTEAQKQKLIATNALVVAVEESRVVLEREKQAAKDALDARVSALRNEQDLTRAQLDLTDNRRDRLAVERRLLDLAYDQERADLEAVIASRDATDAQKKIAQARLGMLGQLQSTEGKGLERKYESPLQGYARRLGEFDTKDAVENYVVDELQHVQDGITSALSKAIGTDDPLITGLINILIQDVLIKPIAEALNNASGSGGGGLLGSIIGGIGSIFGRASGGFVGPGQTVRVNEQRGGAELLRMGSQGGTIIPLGQANQVMNQPNGGNSGGIATVRLELSGDLDARIDERSTNVSVQVVRSSAPAIIGASVTETFRQAGRPKL